MPSGDIRGINMSQTIITSAFEQFKAQQEALVQPVLLDEFVLANVPDQDSTLPIDRNETVPPSEQVVYVADVSQSGYVNPNAVVYSLIMDTGVGDFDFNWIGLRNKSSGILAAISHLPLTAKTFTTAGVKNGNAITRSIMMSYSNAQSLTSINVDASTWQIDFTARLFGIDEAERLANIDHYGLASFLNDGFKVIKEGSVYQSMTGIGYVGGVRCEIENGTDIDNVLKPSAIYLDASWQGQLTSEWNTTTAISSSTEILTDYVDTAGFQHYVTKIADIDANGNITDRRFLGGTPSFERIDNAASNAEIDATSTVTKHVKLTQLWRAISNKITAAFLGRTIATTGAMQGGGNLSTNRTISIQDGNTAQKGAVQLTNSVSSTSTVLGATANALATAYNLAASKINQTTADLRYVRSFQVEDGDGTEVTIKQAKEWKFVEGAGTIDINWTDVSNGSNTDPFDLSFTVLKEPKWSTARTITLGGNCTGSVSMDGSANVTLFVDVNNDSHTHATQYLGLTATATNSAKFGGYATTQFLRSDAVDIKTAGALRFNDNVYLNIGTGNDVEHFWNGSNYYTDINRGAIWYIRDGNTSNATRFTLDVDLGNFAASGSIKEGGAWLINKYAQKELIQFAPWDSTRTYKTGEVCTVEVSGEVIAMQMYAGPNKTCLNKNPTNLNYRHENWSSTTVPFWWIPYTGTEVGMPFWWLDTTAPETAVMEINVDLPIAVYWRLARKYPDLITGSIINTGEIRGEFLRVLDQSRGIDSGRSINSSQSDVIKSHTHAVKSADGIGGTRAYFDAFHGGDNSPNTAGLTNAQSGGGNETRPRNVARAMAITI